MEISEHFTYHELTYSFIANKNNIPNQPDACQFEYMKILAQLLERIRAIDNNPIIVRSGFRSKELNNLIGGEKSSHHMLGFAADISQSKNIYLPSTFAKIISSKLKSGWDQIIAYDKEGFIHVSAHTQRRNQLLRCLYNGSGIQRSGYANL